MHVAQNSFFDGKVTVQQLPVFDPSTNQFPPTLKRVLLSKGELAQFHDAEQAMHYMAFLEMRQGQARGNHFHRVKQEHVYVAVGHIFLRVRNLRDQEECGIRLEPGSLARIDPTVAHVLEPLTDGYAVEFSPTRFDPNDIYPYSFA